MISPTAGRPRVLLVLTGLYAKGGIQRFNQTLLAALHELGADCEVLTLQDTQLSIDDNSVGGQGKHQGFGGSRLRFALAALRSVCGSRFDFVVIGHINVVVLMIAILRLLWWRRPKPVLISHGIEVWTGLGRSRRWAIRGTALILCVSTYTRQRILDQVAALPVSRLQVFPNALSQSWGDTQRRQPSVALPQRYLLSVTRLEKGDRYKGVITVIEALSMLADPAMHYVVVGDGNDLPFLQLAARRLQVTDRVHFLRGISDSELVSMYADCEAFVLPSGKEGFGIVFLEAMYFGAPVIAAAEKGAVDVVHDGKTGLLVRFGDAAGLASAIGRLTGDRKLQDHLRRTARESVVGAGEFTFRRFVLRCADIFATPQRKTA